MALLIHSKHRDFQDRLQSKNGRGISQSVLCSTKTLAVYNSIPMVHWLFETVNVTQYQNQYKDINASVDVVSTSGLDASVDVVSTSKLNASVDVVSTSKLDASVHAASTIGSDAMV